ncbi:MAG: DUF4465 domain-containing protein, partial [Planctomycetota bacterium]|nr:DUF4465 domain-containing protein [Planctomycetota bacterium]
MKKSKRKSSNSKLHRPLSLERLEIRRVLAGPYAPPAGQEGSTAIDAQDPAIEGWASRVIEYTLGTELDEQFSDSSLAIGPVTPGSPSIVSLGRGGQITLGFSSPIRDGLGFDFAVFENGFSDTFLELARVQVSSDGANFFEFESRSLTAEPVSAFGSLDTTNIDGLAGKYRVGFGTPFDLADLRGVDPSLNVDRVTHVRIIDVVGDGSSLDSQGDPIYDPYPTVGSAGFDLDGVAALHLLDTGESEVGFEDVGSSLADESFFSGPIPGGEQSTGEFGEIITSGWFESGGLEFNNTFSDFFEFDFTSWNQWAYSNVTDNVTGGFQNQYGVITGSGAGDSRTFGVAYVDQQGSHAPPTIQKSVEDARQFKSLLLTNTTYAVRSMQNGDSFAKKFGGTSGTDEDFFKLTVTGLDNNGVEIDALEIFLADFRFANSEDDYILEDWVEVDLTPLADAASLEFTLDSSDVGDSGINTPTYFAVDNIQLTEPTLFVDVTPSIAAEDSSDPVTGRVTRFYSDPSSPLTVDLAVDDSSRVGLPASVTIPANTSFVDFSLELINDDLVNGDQSVLVSASATGQIGDQESLLILEDDILSLQLEASETTLSEGNSFSVSVSRNAADLSTSLTVAFSATPDGLIDFPSEVVIPVGQASTTFSISAPEDEIERANEQVQLVAAAADYLDATLLVDWQDNDEATLTLSTSQATYSESDASLTAGFEVIGRTIPDEGFLNGSNQQGEFNSDGLIFNNSYSPDFGGYWAGGWSISNTTDTETAGDLNQ